jgi:hypothetical protein
VTGLVIDLVYLKVKNEIEPTKLPLDRATAEYLRVDENPPSPEVLKMIEDALKRHPTVIPKAKPVRPRLLSMSFASNRPAEGLRRLPSSA